MAHLPSFLSIESLIKKYDLDEPSPKPEKE